METLLLIAFVAAAVGLVMSAAIMYRLVSGKETQQLDF